MKKILILILLFLNFLHSYDCCTEYGFSPSPSEAILVSTVPVSIPATRSSLQEDVHDWGRTIPVLNYGCVSKGVYKNLTQSITWQVTGAYEDSPNRLGSSILGTYEVDCACDLVEHPNTPKHEEPTKELIYDGDATQAPAECYEPQLPYTTYDYLEDCLLKKVCYREIKNCDNKGSDWVYNSSSTADTCFDWVDESTYDAADFENNTCCLHETPDNNDTDPSPSPSPSPTPDNNDTNPSPSPSPSPTFDRSNCPESNPPCIAPMIADPDSCGCILSGTPPSPSPSPEGGGSGGSGGSSSTTNDILNSIKADSKDSHDESMNKMTETNNILNGIKSDMSSQADTNHNDLSSVKSSVDSVRNSVNSVKSSVDSASSKNHADLGEIDDTLGEIKEGTDFLKDLKADAEDSNRDLSEVKENIDSAIVSANNNYSSVLDTFSSIAGSYTNTPPVFTGSGDHVFSTTVYGKPVVFDFSMVANLRQFFDIVFMLLLAYLNFKIYLWIFRFLVKLGV